MAYGNGTNTPFGLRPSNFLVAATFNNQLTSYRIANAYGTALFTGDPVTAANTGTIGIATAGDANPLIGAFQGCYFIDPTGTPVFSQYWPAAQAVFGGAGNYATAFVADDPNIYWDIQSSSANGFAVTDLNNNANLVAGAGSTLSGQSGWSLGVSAAGGGTATYQMKLVQLTPVPGNNPGIAYNNGLCLVNNHLYKGGTGTGGV